MTHLPHHSSGDDASFFFFDLLDVVRSIRGEGSLNRLAALPTCIMLRIALTLGLAFAAIALAYHNRATILFRSILLGLGALQFLSLLLLAFKAIRFFFYHSSDWSAYRDQWALITGASAGIGLELADRLASRGINIILVARRAEVLKEITARLEASYGVKATGFVADLSVPGELVSVASRFPAAPAIIIANGGGLATGGFKQFVEWKQEEVVAAQQLTSGHVYELLRLYLPAMIAKRSGMTDFETDH